MRLATFLTGAQLLLFTTLFVASDPGGWAMRWIASVDLWIVFFLAGAVWGVGLLLVLVAVPGPLWDRLRR